MPTYIANDTTAIRKRMEELGLKGHTGTVSVGPAPATGRPLSWPHRHGFYNDYFKLGSIRSVLRGDASALPYAFSWKESREGEVYWRNICRNLAPLDSVAIRRLHEYIDDCALWAKEL